MPTEPVTRCDCCDLPVEYCGKAAEAQQRAEAAKERARLLAHPAWFPALYPGSCDRCGERFEPGTPIRSEPSMGWRAECCSAGAS